MIQTEPLLWLNIGHNLWKTLQNRDEIYEEEQGPLSIKEDWLIHKIVVPITPFFPGVPSKCTCHYFLEILQHLNLREGHEGGIYF